MTTDFLRLILNISMQNEIIFSNTAMIVEKQANVIKRKNSVPQILPPAIFTNTFGKVMNMSAGPWSGSTPYEKHAGKIISPAIIATKVSSAQIFTDSPGRVSSFDI